MTSRRLFAVLSIVLGVVFTLSLTVSKGDSVARAADVPSRPSAARLKIGDAVPAFALVDQRGRDITAEDLKGRLTVVTFMFTRCPQPEFCPLMAKRFRDLQSAVVKDGALNGKVQLVSVTLDPEFDTPDILSAYARAMGADDTRWRFVTGAPADVATFARAFAVYTKRNGPLLDHTLATALVDGEGRVAEIWRGTYWTSAEVLAAMRR
jgi:protein SCO1/2